MYNIRYKMFDQIESVVFKSIWYKYKDTDTSLNVRLKIIQNCPEIFRYKALTNQLDTNNVNSRYGI